MCRGGEHSRQRALDVLEKPQKGMWLDIVRLEGEMWARQPRALKVSEK